jgi:hypothetical protein
VVPPGDYALGIDLESLRHFLKREQSLFSQPIIARLEVVFAAESGNDATVEPLTATGQGSAFVQNLHDLLVGVMLG